MPGTEMGSGQAWPAPLGPLGLWFCGDFQMQTLEPMVEITAENLEKSELQVQLWGPWRQGRTQQGTQR